MSAIRPTHLMFAAVIAFAWPGMSQVGLGELDAAQAGMNTLDGGSVGPGGGPGYINRARGAAAAAGAPGALPTPAVAPTAPFPNPGAGYNPPVSPVGVPGMPTPMTAYPNLAAPGMPGAAGRPMPGYEGDAGYGVQPGYAQPGQPVVPTPTPIPTIKVLVGKRVYCSVCGMLLEDAVQLDVPQTDQDKYLDDGVHDNGIQNDGIRGNVETIKNVYIGPECNTVKNRLVNLVRHAENLTPMMFFRYHVMSLDRITGSARMPNTLDKEEQRDEALRDWNNKFLADYRVDKNDPKSEYYQLYVPDPPQVPHYPVPPGYISPQKLRQGGTPGPGGIPGATPNIYNGDQVLAPDMPI